MIAGTYRGRRLSPLRTTETRPTTDRVKEAWASTLENLVQKDLSKAIVLDAFAGSGALGIELLSRGAKRVVFCEQNHSAYKTLNENISMLEIQDTKAFHLFKGDVLSKKALSVIADFGPYDVIILDPPFKTPHAIIEKFIIDMTQRKMLNEDALVSYEQSLSLRLPESQLEKWLENISSSTNSSFIMLANKAYGTVALDYYSFTKHQGFS